MCTVGERHLNIVGMKDKFKTHQMELRQNDNVRNMSHSFQGPTQLVAGFEMHFLLHFPSSLGSAWTLPSPH